jgi:hypothetical protein
MKSLFVVMICVAVCLADDTWTEVTLAETSCTGDIVLTTYVPGTDAVASGTCADETL